MGLLSPDEAAESLGVKIQTLAIWRMLGKGPEYVKYEGKTIRYKLESINHFIEKSKVIPGKENE